MEKDIARVMLAKHFGITFPIVDRIVFEDWSDASNVEVYTFRHLLKIAYDLQDIESSDKKAQVDKIYD
jgi:hypothetical protein